MNAIPNPTALTDKKIMDVGQGGKFLRILHKIGDSKLNVNKLKSEIKKEIKKKIFLINQLKIKISKESN